MNRQRGGSLTIIGYTVLLLLVIAAAKGADWYQRTYHISQSFCASVLVVEESSDTDTYATHAFPKWRDVCTYADTICWIKI